MSSPVRWLVTGLFLLPGPLNAQIAADTAAMIDQVFAGMNRSDAPGCSIGLDRAGSPIFRRGYGMASLESGAPMTEFSVVESGSVAKQFTAGVITYLALQGKLSLDDPIRKYVPELPDYGSPITIRMALNHTSGIRDMWTLFSLAGVEPGTHLYTMDRALAMVYRQQELNFPPNSAFLYSNSGFLLLAEVVKRVTGQPLAQVSQEVFFKPLGMTHTQWRDDWNRVVPGRVTAYGRTGGGAYQVDMPFMSVYGAGGLLTTVGDLLKWNEHLTHPTIGGQPWVDLMQQQGRLTDGKQIDYAAGLFMTSYRGEPEISHSGATGGYRTYLARWPARRLSLALLCNVATANTIALGQQVADVFIGAKPGPIQLTAQDGPGTTTKPAMPAAAAELAAVAGAYYSQELDVTYRLTAGDTALTALVGERAPITLRPTGKDEFTGPMGIILKLSRAKNGRADGFRLGAGRVQNLHFVRR